MSARKHTPIPLDLRLLVAAVTAAGFPPPVYEHPVVSGRRFRFDAAWPSPEGGGVAFERHGLSAGGRMGRHQRIEGWMSDLEKSNLAQLNGWLLICAAPRQIASGQAATWVIEALKARRGT